MSELKGNIYIDKESTRPSLQRIINYINTVEIREKDWPMLVRLLELDSDLYLFLLESLTLGEIDLYDLRQVFEYEWYEKQLQHEIEIEKKRREKTGPLLNFRRNWNTFKSVSSDFINTGIAMGEIYYSFFYDVGRVFLGSQKEILPPVIDSIVINKDIWKTSTNVLNQQSRALLEEIKNISLVGLLRGLDNRNLLLEEQMEELNESDLEFMSSNNLTEKQMRKMKTFARRTILEGVKNK